jgi:hypothetical protein
VHKQVRKCPCCRQRVALVFQQWHPEGINLPAVRRRRSERDEEPVGLVCACVGAPAADVGTGRWSGPEERLRAAPGRRRADAPESISAGAVRILQPVRTALVSFRVPLRQEQKRVRPSSRLRKLTENWDSYSFGELLLILKKNCICKFVFLPDIVKVNSELTLATLNAI